MDVVEGPSDILMIHVVHTAVLFFAEVSYCLYPNETIFGIGTYDAMIVIAAYAVAAYAAYAIAAWRSV